MLVGSCMNNCEYRTIRMKNKDKITYNIQLQLNSYILKKIQCVEDLNDFTMIATSNLLRHLKWTPVKK